MKKINATISSKKHLPFKSIVFTTIIVLIILKGSSQSVIKRVTVRDHSNNETLNLFNIDRLVPLRPDQYNLAVNDFLGVIGNDFYGTQILTNIKNDNDWEQTATPTDYFTVNRPKGQKMTFCGKVLTQEYSSGHVDNDLNMQIVCNPKNPAFESKYMQIKNRSRNVYPWAMIEGEIDIDAAFHKFFNPKSSNYNFPVANKTDLCLYGPWVEEVYDGSEDMNPNKDHTDVHEIHPAEQFWWVEKTTSGFRYYLNAAIDASNRFSESNWISNESKNIFAIAFDINKNRTDKIVYQIIDVCNQGTTAPVADGKKHYLMLGQDTLIQVEEPAGTDILSISFEQVGLDPYALLKDKSDSLIKGFLILQSNIKNNNSLYTHGNLKLLVDKKTVTKVATTQFEAGTPVLTSTTLAPSIYKRVKVTLKEITTLENHLNISWGQWAFKLTGYIFVEKGTDNIPFSKSSNKIIEDKPQLLFPLSPDIDNNRVIHHDLGGNGIGSKSTFYNSSVTIGIAKNESINVISDFEASYVSDFIRTLELVDQRPFKEMKIGLSDLRKDIPLIKEMELYNWERDSKNDPKKYKMRIKLEFLLLD